MERNLSFQRNVVSNLFIQTLKLAIFHEVVFKMVRTLHQQNGEHAEYVIWQTMTIFVKSVY